MNGTRSPMLVSLLLLPSLLCLAGCGGPQDPASRADPEAVKQARARAVEVVGELGSTLRERLVAEMQQGGPEQAVRVCSEVAGELAASYDTDTLTLRRVSLKVRNPADTPDDFERELLESWEASHRDGQSPGNESNVVEGPDGLELRFLKPIMVQPECLVCHGSEADRHPGAAALIAERYPGDMATGYKAGDLRGAFSVRVRL